MSMLLTLGPETQKLIEERMKLDGFPTPEDVVRAALEFLDAGTQELDEETLSALEEGEAELDRGEGISLEEVFDQLRTKYPQP